MLLCFDEKPASMCPYCHTNSLLLLGGGHILCKNADRGAQMLAGCRFAKHPVSLDEARRWPAPVPLVDTVPQIETQNDVLARLRHVPGTTMSGTDLNFRCPKCRVESARWRLSEKQWSCRRCGEHPWTDLPLLLSTLPSTPSPILDSTPSLREMVDALTDEATRQQLPKGVIIDTCKFCGVRRGFGIQTLMKPAHARCTACGVTGSLPEVYELYRKPTTHTEVLA